MRIQELVEAVPVGSSTQPVANTNVPPQQPGTPPPKPIPGQPPAPGQPPQAAPGQPQLNQQKPGQPQQPGTPQKPSLGNQNPNAAAAAPAAPSPEIKQGMQAMSDQFNALKLKYDQLQKQILNPAAPTAHPTAPPAQV